MAAEDVVYAHLDAYFCYVNPVSWHGFLHRGVMYERLASGSVPRMLLLGLCAVTSTFVSTSASAAAQAEAWAREVKHEIMVRRKSPRFPTRTNGSYSAGLPRRSATCHALRHAPRHPVRRGQESARERVDHPRHGRAAGLRSAAQRRINRSKYDLGGAGGAKTVDVGLLLPGAPTHSAGPRNGAHPSVVQDKFVGGGILDVMNVGSSSWMRTSPGLDLTPSLQVSETSLKIQLPCQDINFNDQVRQIYYTKVQLV